MNAAKLKHVIAVDRCGSISAAARALSLTQSTVSRSLADIERETGYALFDRRARDVIATDRGRAFLTRAARIISDLEQLSEDSRLNRLAEETLIRVGVCPASMQGLVNKAVMGLILSRPDLRLHLEATTVGGGVRALRRGDIDVLVGPEDAMKSDDDFAFERLGALKTFLFARKTHPLAAKTSLKKSDIAAYSVIAPDRMSWHTDKLRSLYASLGGDAARRMHVIEYFPLIADIVAESDAIGVVSAEYSETKTFRQRFSLLSIDFFEPLTVGFAVRKRWMPTAAMRVFQGTLKEFPPAAESRSVQQTRE
ncbi:MAG TPA: LysR family transcriptional regulator [Parvularculaceae bacterium]|nr:LysR family transcriptional regulator [Parvularculaceae bacterium]HNS87156.1 LysR family transcriptional regulator [Parvularculaceae bacterium]